MSKYFDDGICRYLFTPYDEASDTDGFYTAERCPRQVVIVELPDEINGSPVTAISDLAFNGKSLLKKLKLSCNITKIGALAFNGCNVLERIVIPPKVKSIGRSAFANCAEMRSIILPPSVESIGEGAFENSDALEKVYVVKGSYAHKWIAKNFYGEELSDAGELEAPLEKIVFYSPEIDGPSESRSPTYNFDIEPVDGGIEITHYCDNEETVKIPSEIGGKPVVSIGAEIFRGSTRVQVVHIPETVKNISFSAFDMAPILGNITVSPESKSFSSEGGVLFNKRKDTLVRCPLGLLAEEYTVPEGVTEIAHFAFQGCCLANIYLPSTLKIIGDRSFSNCLSLKKIVLPPSLTDLGECAFANCPELREITIPPFLSNIGPNALRGCRSLLSAYVLPTSYGRYILKMLPETDGHLRMPPADYCAKCLQMTFDNMEAGGSDVERVKEEIVEALEKCGFDPTDIAESTGIPEFAEMFGFEAKKDNDKKKNEVEPPKEPGKKMPKGNAPELTFITNMSGLSDILSKLPLNGGDLNTEEAADFLSSLLDRFYGNESEEETDDQSPEQVEEPDPIELMSDEEFEKFLAKIDSMIERSDELFERAKAQNQAEDKN